MKICKACLIEKPLDEFHNRTKAKDGKQYVCKICNRNQRKAYYKTAHGRDKNFIAGKRWRVRNQLKVLDYLKDHSCVDCGENDPIVLEFDHRENKSYNISHMVQAGFAWAKIMEEIEKCDIRCANCHRRKTARQFGYYKLS